MNPFDIISVLALEGRLPQGMDARYYASIDFRARSELKGEGALEDQLHVTHYLLKRIALHPAYAHQALAYLDKGCVLLEFFGVANPVPLFGLDPHTEEAAQLRRAILDNMGGPLFDAAKRVLRWREPTRVRRSEERIERLLALKHASLPFPKPSQFREDPAGARRLEKESIEALDAYLDSVRGLRHKRLRKLYQAAAPGLVTGTDLLLDIAATVLAPPSVSRQEALRMRAG